MQKRAIKDSVYEQLARVGKAVASPKRVELLDLLTQGERTVESLAVETGLSVANTSQHLQVLRAAQLVEARKDGLFVYYRAAVPVGAFLRELRFLAEAQLADLALLVARFQEEQGGVESIGSVELAKRLKNGSVVLIDTRPASEYAAGHIPGAIHIPVDALPQKMRALPKDKEIVAYCRGPYCLFASEAVRLLRKKGYKAVRMHEGVADWRALGKPVEVSAGSGEPVRAKRSPTWNQGKRP